jgi:hypothetical protein
MTAVNLAEALDVLQRVQGISFERLQTLTTPLVGERIKLLPIDEPIVRRAADVRARRYHRTSAPSRSRTASCSPLQENPTGLPQPMALDPRRRSRESAGQGAPALRGILWGADIRSSGSGTRSGRSDEGRTLIGCRSPRKRTWGSRPLLHGQSTALAIASPVQALAFRALRAGRRGGRPRRAHVGRAPQPRVPARLRRDGGDAVVRGETGDQTDQESRSAGYRAAFRMTAMTIHSLRLPPA